MASTADRDELLKLCRLGEHDQAMALAFQVSDTVGMLLVSILELGSYDRLGLLLQTDEGPLLGTEITLAGIDDYDPDGALTQLALNALDQHRGKLGLTVDQADRALERIHLANDPIAPEHGAAVLRWVASNQASRALAFARGHVAQVTVGSPSALDLAAADLLGRSGAPEDHDALLTYAERYLEAGDASHHGELAGRIASLTNSDVEELISHLGRYSSNGWAPGPAIANLLTQLTVEQLRSLGTATQATLSEAWFTSHLLPALFTSHAARLADTLDESWWPQGALDWLITQARWSDHDPELLGIVLRSVKRRNDPARIGQAYSLIRAQTVAAEPDHDVKSAMPRFGARLLLREALAGKMAPDNAELVAALGHLDVSLRVAEYREANWQQPSRATRMARVITSVGVDELVKVIDPMLSLRDPSRLAFVAAAAPQLTEPVAEQLAIALGDDTQALTALAGGEKGADAVLDRWQQHHHLPSFRALADTRHKESRLASISPLVRDHTAGLLPDQRRELLDALPADSVRYELLLSILSEWGGHPRPDDDTLVHALELVADHLRSGADPTPFIQVGGALCRQHPRLRVRSSAYEAFGVAEPTAGLTDLLQERLADETSAGKTAVRAAIDAVTTRLVLEAESDDPQRAMTAVTMLGYLNPQQALPFARQLTETATSSEDRIRAIQIVAHHGDRSSDPALLRRIVEGDTAHPDRSVRVEAERGIRRLEVGDLHAAHERLGDLAGKNPNDWNTLDPTRLFGTWGNALQTGLDRVAENESNQLWGQAIDQLGEVAKILLYRAIELAGTDAGLGSNLVSGASGNRLDFGNVVGRQELLNTWGWVHHFAALYNLRTEHITQRGSQATPPKRERGDLEHALRLFRDGAAVCCDVISMHAP